MIGGRGKVIWGHMRPQSVFSPITRDRMEIETRKWCQTTWIVKPLRKKRILTYLGHDLTWSDLRSGFEIDLSRSKSTCFKPARWGVHDGVIYIFISLIKKLSMKSHLREKRQFFIWRPLVPKSLILGRIWSQNVIVLRKESSPILFLNFSQLSTSGNNSDYVAKKSLFSQNLTLVTSGDLNIDLTWRWPQ